MEIMQMIPRGEGGGRRRMGGWGGWQMLPATPPSFDKSPAQNRLIAEMMKRGSGWQNIEYPQLSNAAALPVLWRSSLPV